MVCQMQQRRIESTVDLWGCFVFPGRYLGGTGVVKCLCLSVSVYVADLIQDKIGMQMLHFDIVGWFRSIYKIMQGPRTLSISISIYANHCVTYDN